MNTTTYYAEREIAVRNSKSAFWAEVEAEKCCNDLMATNPEQLLYNATEVVHKHKKLGVGDVQHVDPTTRRILVDFSNNSFSYRKRRELIRWYSIDDLIPVNS